MNEKSIKKIWEQLIMINETNNFKDGDITKHF